jgi:hypothetical protein
VPFAPFSRPFKGLTDGTGSVTLRIPPVSHVAFFSGYVVGVAPAPGATFNILDEAGNLVAGAGGITNAIGPLRLNPGDRAQLAVTGALPGVPINCMLLGDVAADPADLGHIVAPTQAGLGVAFHA